MTSAIVKKVEFVQQQTIKYQTHCLGWNRVTPTDGEITIIFNELTELKKKLELLEEQYFLAKTGDEAEAEQEATIETNKKSLSKLQFTVAEIKRKRDLLSAAPSPKPFKLEKLKLPDFTGKFCDWPSFEDLFTSAVVNNPSLSDSERMVYLKTALIGEAATIVSSFSNATTSFPQAWSLVKKRYSNKREIVFSHIRKFDEFKPIQENSQGLRKLIDIINELFRSLTALGVPIDQWDVMLVYMALKKVDYETKKEWLLTQNTDLPKLSDFLDYLEKRSTALADATTNRKPTSSFNQSKSTKFTSSHVVEASKSSPRKIICPKCKEPHHLYHCNDFKSIHTSEKQKFVKDNNLCFNCLFPGHSVKKCTNTSLCRKCNSKHHTLLHIDTKLSYKPKSDTNVPSSSNATKQSSSTEGTENATTADDKQVHHSDSVTEQSDLTVLFKTAIGLVLDSNGKKQTCRIFFDAGSETHFISEYCVNRLGLKRQKTCVQVGGIGGAETGKAHGLVNLNVFSKYTDDNIEFCALVLPKLTKLIPKVKCKSSFSYLKGIQLADPSFNVPGSIDILIGVPLTGKVKLPGFVIGPDGCPDAQNTIFGWTLSGQAPTESHSPTTSYTVSTFHANCSIHDSCLDSTIRRFWELEEPESNSTPMSTEDEQAEDIFQATTVRNKEGRYVVRLPFKSDFSGLGHSRSQAVKRLLSVERSLIKNADISKSYYEQFDELISNGLIQEVNNSSVNSSNCYYMPHHVVTKQESTSTKHRIVFDASCKTSNGLSLNDVLLTGPKTQTDLVSLLIRFRKHKVAISADIVKFFNQFCVNEFDYDYQRLVFRHTPKGPVKDYKMVRVCFGVTTAPYLASRCLFQLAEDYKSSFPLLYSIIKNDFLVDNLLSGCETIHQALDIQREMIELLSKAQLKLRKWSSNKSQLLNAVPEEDRETTQRHINDNLDISTIGLLWKPSTDTFSVKLYEPLLNSTVTKRKVLSAIAKTFDPLGWLSPVTIRLKILLQHLWKERSGWDEIISSEHYQKWYSYCKELPLLKNFSLKRCFTANSTSDQSYELLGYCDASNSAYAACVYLKCNESVNLIVAKTKVTPVRGETIPRLELCGALLLARLVHTTCASLQLNISQVYCFSDSTIVLSWLSTSEKLPVFIHNRVSKISSLIPNAIWSHIDGDKNPADMASRGVSVKQFLDSKEWLYGPSFTSSSTLNLTTTVTVNIKSINSSYFYNQLSSFISKTSDFNKMKRVLGHWIKYIRTLRSKSKIRSLEVSDLKSALSLLIKCVQQETFKDELKHLVRKESIKSQIKFLCPFIDSDGILRVGGRLRKSFYNYETKHPALLPKNHHFTLVLVRHFHETNLHAGPQLLLSLIREQFWIIRGPQVCTQVVRNCVVCAKANPVPASQVMGQLPSVRVTPSRPFTNTSIDYAGPFYLCVTPGRKPKLIKAYVCIFVCMAVKAVHIEFSGDLTTESYVGALRRFIGRRGLPSDIYCDGGSNFIGHRNELLEIQQFLSTPAHQNRLYKFFVDKNIKYHRNPPHAPNFGGLHEAAVKSMKIHLKKIVGDRHLSIEEFITLICQVESALNSRPITPLSSDPNDFSFLTPGHFLTGGPLLAAPQENLDDINMHRLSRWQLVQQMTQHFFNRWSQQYIQSLQKSTKWFKEQPNFGVGQLVMLLDSDSAVGPQKWKMGRITKAFPDSSGNIRVFDVDIPTTNDKQKVKISTYRRSITKIAPLPT